MRIRPIKHPNYSWYTTYTVDGKRRKRYFTSRKAARDFVAQTLPQAQSAEGDPIGLVTPEEHRAISLWRQLKATLELRDLETLVTEEAERCRSIEASSTLQAASEAMLSRRRLEGKKPRTLENLRLRLGHIVRYFGEDTLMATVTTDHIDTWLSGLGLAPGTVVNYRRVAHALWSEGMRRGWCKSNPVAYSYSPTMEEKPIGILALEHGSTLLANIEKRLLAPVLIQGWCGLRRSELCDHLVWNDITKTHVRVPSGKTGRRIVPIHANVSSMLETARNDSAEKVWPWDERHYSLLLRRCMEKLEMPRSQNVLRHSFCTYRLAATQDLAKTALEAGNSPDIIRKHYAEIVTEEVGKAWFDQLSKS